MDKLFHTYAARKGMRANSFRFSLDGMPIRCDDTPRMLDLEDQDQIDVIIEQVRVSGTADLS
jgi:small ubiquitin-related modifier